MDKPIMEPTHIPTAPTVDAAPQHTPGPWRAALGEDDDPRRGEFELAELPHHIFGTCIYAPGDYYSDDHAEHVANAHLIAAAPDLLAACKSALGWYGLDGDGISDPTLSQLRAAIKKAEGSHVA